MKTTPRFPLLFLLKIAIALIMGVFILSECSPDPGKSEGNQCEKQCNCDGTSNGCQHAAKHNCGAPGCDTTLEKGKGHLHCGKPKSPNSKCFLASGHSGMHRCTGDHNF